MLTTGSAPQRWLYRNRRHINVSRRHCPAGCCLAGRGRRAETSAAKRFTAAPCLPSSLLTVFFSACSEWYGYHFPELIKIVSDNSMYCRVARLIGNRKELSEESLEGLEEVVMDASKAQAILEASRSSMGQ